jgi:hypothetical protein
LEEKDMMKITPQMTKPADECLASLLEVATNNAIRTKLENQHDVCRSVVVETQQRLSVPEVLRRYKARFLDASQAIAEPTIRNKRAKGNPYRALYRKWEEVASHIFAVAGPRAIRAEGGIIAEGDITAIEDPVLRSQIRMLFAQNRSLQNQINILKQSESAVPLKMDGPRLEGGANLLLTDAELDAVCDFIDPKKLGAKHLARTPDDGIKLKDGRVVADPGFASALEKIAHSYKRG